MQTSGKKACFLFPECSLAYTKLMQTSGKKACFLFPECSLAYTKLMQTSGKKSCFQFPECSLAYTKLMRGERNSKAGKHGFTGPDITEQKLSFDKS